MASRRGEEPSVRELSRSARWRADRGQVDEAVRLFLQAAERAEADAATGNEALDEVANAALVLVKAGRHDAARPHLERLAASDYRGRLVDHVCVQRLLDAVRRGDGPGFSRVFGELVARGPVVPWAIPCLIDASVEIARWEELGHLVGAAERWHRKLPRDLARRIDAALAAVPQAERANVAAVRAGVRHPEAPALPATKPRRPDADRRPLTDARATHTVSRGLFLALTFDELRALRRLTGDADRRAFIAALEERWEREWVCETDKSWRYLWLLLADPRTSAPRVDLFFGKRLHGASFHHTNLLEGAELERAAVSLRALDDHALKARYQTWSTRELHRHLGVTATPPFDYLATWYARIREFIARAAAARRPVVFDADA